jgi:CheY-like chemotaxis protein
MKLQARRRSKRILIADDDPVMRHLLISIVKKEGYEAVAVDDGREAFRLLQSDADFRAGIFDMMMPHLEGLDIIRYMRTEKRLQRIPVMMITAEQDLQLMARSFVAGVTVFLSKPCNAEQIENTLRILLTPTTIPRRLQPNSHVAA